jgi:hypothetical protein
MKIGRRGFLGLFAPALLAAAVPAAAAEEEAETEGIRILINGEVRWVPLEKKRPDVSHFERDANDYVLAFEEKEPLPPRTVETQGDFRFAEDWAMEHFLIDGKNRTVDFHV